MMGNKQLLEFPHNFFWGASTAAHQVEGNNLNDWSEWEKENAERLANDAKHKWSFSEQEQFPEMFKRENYISSRACDFYNLYAKDLDLAKSLGLNAFRFSIEWARIESKEGNFDKKEIEHYRDVIKALKERGLEPFVSLWHFTNPIWFADKGGWEQNRAPFYFNRYVGEVVKALSKEVKFWIIFNEPGNFISQGYLTATWPPAKRNLLSAIKVWRNLIQANRLAFTTIKKIDRNCEVGSVDGISFYDAKNDWLSFVVKRILEKLSYAHFLDRIKDYQDFIGLNYYHRALVHKFSASIINRKPISDLGWELYPRGIYYVLKDLAKYKKPIYVTESGIADALDEKRAWYIKEILKNVYDAIHEGVDVRGHFYWSLLDNFEWDKGFWPRFGLVEVNYKNMKRKIRQSAREYAKIIKNNAITL